MKKIILYSVIAILCFSVGYFTCLKVNTDSIKARDFKVLLIATQSAALDQANKVMWNNDLFDADGSDDMAEYLDLHIQADSLLNSCY